MHTDYIVQALPFIPPKRMLPELLKNSKIQTNRSDLKSFSQEVKKNSQGQLLKFSLSDFRSMLFAWYQNCHYTDLRLKLLNTIHEFEEIKEGKLLNIEKESVENLLETLKSKLKELPNYGLKNDNFEEKCIAGLHEIFNYYSKQQFLLGKSPTFDNIKSNTEVLTIGKFLRFCKDFKIIDETDKAKEKKALKDIQKAFVQSAEYGRSMQEHHFISAVNLLAEKFFDKEFDKNNNTSWKNISANEKKIKFYEFLQCHNPNIYIKKLKGSVSHFGVEPYDRIPDYDLSKKYKFRPKKLEKDKESIEEWKQKKLRENGEKEKIEEEKQKKKNLEKNRETFEKKIEKIRWEDLNKMQADSLEKELGIEESDEEKEFDGKEKKSGVLSPKQSKISVNGTLSNRIEKPYGKRFEEKQFSYRTKSEYN